jgi:ABC-2 type transport system ATP-binding protein
VILSSQLLPDVERVCDEVMVLAAGKLQYLGTIAALRGDGDARYTVRVKEGIERLAEALRGAGLEAEVDGEEMTLKLPGGDTDAVFAAAEKAGVQIRHLAPLRRSLEAAFLSTLRGAP